METMGEEGNYAWALSRKFQGAQGTAPWSRLLSVPTEGPIELLQGHFPLRPAVAASKTKTLTRVYGAMCDLALTHFA